GVQESSDHFLCTLDERCDIAFGQRIDRCTRRTNDVETLRVDLFERDLAVHRSVRELDDFRIAIRENIDAFDRDEGGVDVEEDEPVAGGERVAASRRIEISRSLLAARCAPTHAITILTRSENRSR